jgi:hypothetical protein
MELTLTIHVGCAATSIASFATTNALIKITEGYRAHGGTGVTGIRQSGFKHSPALS